MPSAESSQVANLLSIAGSDSSGGAGIQADLATFAALRCYGTTAITAVTAQNTRQVAAIHLVPPEFVARQIDVIFADIEIAAVKIGMLGSAATVAAVAARIAAHRPPFVVLDPVLAASTGAALASADVAEALVRHLFPLATLVTPNLAEAAILCGRAQAPGLEGMYEAAAAIRARGARAVLVKGGHGAGASCDDLLLDGDARHLFSAPRVATSNTHGTGCTLSAAITAHLARGADLAVAVEAAKTYVLGALAAASRLAVGHGPGPLHHFHELWGPQAQARPRGGSRP